MRTGTATLLLVALLACDRTREGDDPRECRDGADNDADGLFDCEDDGCSGSPDCEGDSDTDADADSDSDSDSDADADADTDADTDADSDEEPWADSQIDCGEQWTFHTWSNVEAGSVSAYAWQGMDGSLELALPLLPRGHEGVWEASVQASSLPSGGDCGQLTAMFFGFAFYSSEGLLYVDVPSWDASPISSAGFSGGAGTLSFECGADAGLDGMLVHQVSALDGALVGAGELSTSDGSSWSAEISEDDFYGAGESMDWELFYDSVLAFSAVDEGAMAGTLAWWPQE